LTFTAVNLPSGLTLDPITGVLSGSPVYSGQFNATIYATDKWGTGTQTLHFNILPAIVGDLGIFNVITNYSAPYLLDIQFSLGDNVYPQLAQAVVTSP